MAIEEENLLPEFHILLAEAHAADEAEALFDVDSSNPESKAQWDSLRQRSTEAKARLIGFINKNPNLLTQILSLTQ